MHTATSLRIVGRHKRRPCITLDQARDIIQSLAVVTTRKRADQRLVEELERATSMRIDELAELTKEWLPTSGEHA